MSTENSKWYDSRFFVVTLLIVFFPIGVYALIRNRRFKTSSKGLLAGFFTLVLVLAFGNAENTKKLAREAGYESASEYLQAKELGLNSREQLLAHLEQVRMEDAQKAEKRIAQAKADKELEEKTRDRSRDATIVCREFVRASLRSPSTADFPWTPNKRFREGYQTYIIKSHVDAQNAFGAVIRNQWHCKLRYIGGEEHLHSSWDLLELEVL